MARDEKKGKGLLQPRETGGDEQPWLLTYGDMVTLLMTFFVLMFAISTIDPVKMEMISNSIKDVVGGKQPVEKKLSLQEIQQKVNELIVEENLQDEVDVRPSYRGVKVVSRGDITFESGKADLTSKIKPFLMKLAKIIREAPFPVAVEGHTDNVPIQSKKYPSNWELSSARASETVRFFIDLGVPKDRLRAIGFADTRPVDTNDTDEGRARNRRVEIIFLTAT